MRIFKTFKPKNSLLLKAISYYYIDIADDEDYFNEYVCYPHFNNTVSLYQNHTSIFKGNHSKICFKEDGSPLQIFTPIRQSPFKVNQIGPVFKITIVFNAFGINQFIKQKIRFNQISVSPDFEFFDNETLVGLFKLNTYQEIINRLETELLKLLHPLENTYIENALQWFHEEENELTIDELAEKKLGISRKQFTRLFQEYLGVSPQKYRSIVRFRQLMNYKLDNKTANNLGILSHQAHYTDQSHFVKACKQLTGLTPSQFFKAGQIIGSEDTFWKFG